MKDKNSMYESESFKQILGLVQDMELSILSFEEPIRHYIFVTRDLNKLYSHVTENTLLITKSYPTSPFFNVARHMDITSLASDFMVAIKENLQAEESRLAKLLKSLIELEVLYKNQSTRVKAISPQYQKKLKKFRKAMTKKGASGLEELKQQYQDTIENYLGILYDIEQKIFMGFFNAFKLFNLSQAMECRNFLEKHAGIYDKIREVLNATEPKISLNQMINCPQVFRRSKSKSSINVVNNDEIPEKPHKSPEPVAYIAFTTHQSSMPSGLSFSVGDIFYVCQHESNGWVYAIKDSTHREGWVPISFLVKVEDVKSSISTYLLETGAYLIS